MTQLDGRFVDEDDKVVVVVVEDVVKAVLELLLQLLLLLLPPPLQLVLFVDVMVDEAVIVQGCAGTEGGEIDRSGADVDMDVDIVSAVVERLHTDGDDDRDDDMVTLEDVLSGSDMAADEEHSLPAPDIVLLNTATTEALEVSLLPSMSSCLEVFGTIISLLVSFNKLDSVVFKEAALSLLSILVDELPVEVEDEVEDTAVTASLSAPESGALEFVIGISAMVFSGVGNL